MNNRILYIWVVLILLSVSRLYTQNTEEINGDFDCDKKVETTHWDNIKYPNTANTMGFDWTQEFFDVYYKVDNNTNIHEVVRSPFYAGLNSTSNPNLNVLQYEYINNGYDNKYLDFHPEDGWEIVHLELGTPTDYTENPSLVLYNKYESKLRIFILVTKLHNSHSGMYIHLKFPANMRRTALLNGNTGEQTMLEWNPDRKLDTPNKFYESGSTYWGYADFSVAYDFCTCYFDDKLSQIEYELQFFDQGDITLEGSSYGRTEQIMTGGTTKPATNQSFDFFGVIDDAFKKGSETYESYTKVTDAIKKWEKKNRYTPQVMNNPNFFQKLSNIFFRVKEDHVLGAGTKFGQLALKGVNLIGAVSGVMDFINMLGSAGKGDQNTQVSPMPKVFFSKTDYKFTGTIITPFGFSSTKITVPGSKDYNPNVIYNNTLGVFNIDKKPEAKFIRFQKQSAAPTLHAGTNGDLSMYQFKLDNPVWWTINPASGLEVLDIKVSVKFEFPNQTIDAQSVYARTGPDGVIGTPRYFAGPVIFGNFSFNGLLAASQTQTWDFYQGLSHITPFEKYVNDNNFEIADWIDNGNSKYALKNFVFRTPWVDMQCMEYQTFYTWGPTDLTKLKDDIKMTFQVIVAMKTKDSEESDRPAILLLSYPLEIKPENKVESSSARFIIQNSFAPSGFWEFANDIDIQPFVRAITGDKFYLIL